MPVRGVVSSLATLLSLVLPGCQVTPSARATELQEPRPTAKVDAPPSPSPVEALPAPRATAATDLPEVASEPRPDGDRVPSACPEEMVHIGETCVDRYEAHLVVQQGDGSLQRHPEFERPPEKRRFEARSAPGVRPQAYISSLEARTACENAGKRLCSLEEWSMACRGPEDTTYPYGKEFDRHKCNMGKRHILAELYGKDPLAWTYEGFNDPELIKQGALAASGEYSACTNAYGAFDMVGNLHEWVADRVDRTLPSKLDMPKKIERTVPRKRGNGIFMGGFFSTFHQHGRGCNFITIAHEPRYHDYSTGFRCCRDAASPEGNAALP